MKKGKVNLNTVKTTILRDDEGKEHVLVTADEKFYCFRNMLPGDFFFVREDGTDGHIGGLGIIEDITEKERKMLRKSGSFKNGDIVEENEEFDESLTLYDNFTDIKLQQMFEKYGKDHDYMSNWVNRMNSVMSINRLRAYAANNNYPAVVLTLCDARIAQIEQEYEEKNRAPIFNEKGE